MFRFLGTMMYSSQDMIRVREIARELKQKQEQEKDNAEDAHALDLFKKADQVYMLFKERDSLLSNLGKEPLQDTICFICHQEKKKGDTYLKYLPQHEEDAGEYHRGKACLDQTFCTT